MDIYSVLSRAYDLLDVLYFSEKGKNPREVIMGMIPNKQFNVLDMCCGTLANTSSIAKNNPEIKVLGLDLSPRMLAVARKKKIKQHLDNVDLKYADATNTGINDKSFDYVIIGLILHESSPALINGILNEAYRVLKDDGSLIILEWEKQKEIHRIIKFAPLYFLELNCRTFKQFYEADKRTLFEKYGFKTEQLEHCNYSVVLKLKKFQNWKQ